MTATRTSTASAERVGAAPAAAADRRARASCRSSTTRCCRASPSARRLRARASATALSDGRRRPGRAARAQPRGHRARDARVRERRPRRRARRHAHLRARPCASRARSARRGCRSAWPTSSPCPEVTAAWDMADLTYNQGVHGAQDTANAMVRAGRPFHVITDDWHARRVPRARSSRWARAAAAVTALAVAEGRRVRLRDERAWATSASTSTRCCARSARRSRARARATCTAPPQAVAARRGRRADRGRGRALRDRPARCSAEEREDHARMQIAHRADPARARLRRVLDALRRDRRGRPLRAAAAGRRLDADGQGLRLRAPRATRSPPRWSPRATSCSATRTSPRCTRWTSRRDSILMSHMGEGNWAIARTDRPVAADQAAARHRRARRPADVPVPVPAGPGDAGDAGRRSAASRFRLVVAEGEILDTEELPALEMPYGHFRPDSGVRACMDAWLRLGGPHHQVMHLGRHAGALAQLLRAHRHRARGDLRREAVSKQAVRDV